MGAAEWSVGPGHLFERRRDVVFGRERAVWQPGKQRHERRGRLVLPGDLDDPTPLEGKDRTSKCFGNLTGERMGNRRELGYQCFDWVVSLGIHCGKYAPAPPSAHENFGTGRMHLGQTRLTCWIGGP